MTDIARPGLKEELMIRQQECQRELQRINAMIQLYESPASSATTPSPVVAVAASGTQKSGRGRKRILDTSSSPTTTTPEVSPKSSGIHLRSFDDLALLPEKALVYAMYHLNVPVEGIPSKESRVTQLKAYVSEKNLDLDLVRKYVDEYYKVKDTPQFIATCSDYVKRQYIAETVASILRTQTSTLVVNDTDYRVLNPPKLHSVIKHRAQIRVMQWGRPIFGVERTVRGFMLVPDGFKAEVIADQRTWTIETSVCLYGREHILMYRFSLLEFPDTMGDWCKTASTAFSNAYYKNTPVDKIKNKTYMNSEKCTMNGQKLAGVTYTNIQDKMYKVFGEPMRQLHAQLTAWASSLPTEIAVLPKEHVKRARISKEEEPVAAVAATQPIVATTSDNDDVEEEDDEEAEVSDVA